MKFMHLSDLHIGKRVNEFSMLEDQRYILNQILSIADREKPDGVWIAGDVYDKAVPSAEAVQLFDEFLTGLVRRRILVFVISGNHDSPERIAFGARLVDQCGVYLSPVFRGQIAPVTLEDEYGKLNIYLLPFLKPVHVRQAWPEEKVESYEDAVRLVLDHICGRKAAQTEEEEQTGGWNPGARNILVAHQFVTGAARCESEDVTVGGVDQIPAELFADFDYVALGHIHSPQHIGRETVRYCGTPLSYSFSEAAGSKSVTMVELKEKGTVELKLIPLCPKRDMREIRGTYMELTALEYYKDRNREDYLHVTLTDEEDIPGVLGKLRSIYPNIMKLDYDNLRTRSSRNIEIGGEAEQKTPIELFDQLYELQNNQKMSEEQKSFASELIRQIWQMGE